MYFNDHSYFDNRFELIPSSQCGSAWRKIRFLYAFLKASKLLQNLLCGRHPGAKLRCFEVQCVPTVCSECDSVFPYGNKLLSGRPLHIPVPTPCTFWGTLKYLLSELNHNLAQTTCQLELCFLSLWIEIWSTNFVIAPRASICIDRNKSLLSELVFRHISFRRPPSNAVNRSVNPWLNGRLREVAGVEVIQGHLPAKYGKGKGVISGHAQFNAIVSNTIFVSGKM